MNRDNIGIVNKTWHHPYKLCTKSSEYCLSGAIAGVTIEFIDDQSCLWALCLTFGTERFFQISAGPHLSSLGRIFRCDHDIGTQ